MSEVRPFLSDRARRALRKSVTIAVACVLGGALYLVSGTAAAQADPAGDQSPLVALTGSGTGLVIISPTSALTGMFQAHVEVNIHDAAPNTEWTVVRVGDLQPDGLCPDTGFGQVASFSTSAGGAGAVQFVRTGFPVRFDVVVRVVGTDGTVLQSDCMTITPK